MRFIPNGIPDLLFWGAKLMFIRSAVGLLHKSKSITVNTFMPPNVSNLGLYLKSMYTNLATILSTISRELSQRKRSQKAWTFNGTRWHTSTYPSYQVISNIAGVRSVCSMILIFLLLRTLKHNQDGVCLEQGLELDKCASSLMMNNNQKSLSFTQRIHQYDQCLYGLVYTHWKIASSVVQIPISVLAVLILSKNAGTGIGKYSF